MCSAYIDARTTADPNCTFPNCKYSHDVKTYLENKEPDVDAECFVFKTLGHCPRGITCRFASGHLDENYRNLINTDIYTGVPQERNQLNKGVQIRLRKHEYDFTMADSACNLSFELMRQREEKEKIQNGIKEEDKSQNGIKDNDESQNGNKEEDKSQNGIKENDKSHNGIKEEDKSQNGIKEEDKSPNGIKNEDTSQTGLEEKKNEMPNNGNHMDVSDAKEISNEEIEPVENKSLELKPSEKADLSLETDLAQPVAKKPRLEEKSIGPVSDTDMIPLKPQEKKKLDWEDKLYLAPLTTVGNLPFRRLCKRLGADITCSEMALGLPLLQGHPPEWALVQRHQSEDFFGVQVCGCSPPQMSRVAQLLEEQVDCDFVDINMGCPIDLIYKKGMGSGLMIRKRPLEIISRTMAGLMSRPLTIKMRTGVFKDKNIAHLLFPKLEELGVSGLTIHGRSKEQRYTRLADWEYIKECRETVNIPVFGNGDILNYEDYYMKKENSGVSGIMLARGALIKPWLFTEIKERRHWDISGQERLDIVREFANYGLEHWGSDDRGLENTRKFLLEWLSFAYRYVPYGILKCPPQRINERLPVYRGRNELETLLSSPNAQDWLKITEMFLGKVKDGFEFVPRHKANSYS
ncbi:tRNA-dihydrouridine(47) synthase [NAD(P)(+)]-like [Eurytemora carolleeae]|uniref:tRNA-dihydrouridine(47) synthase [NAD(P)(+)]-like n=1 Tax=Eurytemora carolleeae TaxID=1294199 RepID=UPI000C7590AB|nr:tRNA-dihydrouridine(47) synthase [NAD(P)(+)]-like [Eurytemora carolleeae]|eukprot:XP_023348376.1 tRNA-dihydrouridine(47) synthase [NAD(P)(+)]-like [Eurytemora affinis]